MTQTDEYLFTFLQNMVQRKLGISVPSRIPTVKAAYVWQIYLESENCLKKIVLGQAHFGAWKYGQVHQLILRDKFFEAMKTLNWSVVLEGAIGRCPSLLDFVTVTCNKRGYETVHHTGAQYVQRVTPIGIILCTCFYTSTKKGIHEHRWPMLMLKGINFSLVY